jgi:hypothetical protein
LLNPPSYFYYHRALKYCCVCRSRSYEVNLLDDGQICPLQEDVRTLSPWISFEWNKCWLGGAAHHFLSHFVT